MLHLRLQIDIPIPGDDPILHHNIPIPWRSRPRGGNRRLGHMARNGTRHRIVIFHTILEAHPLAQPPSRSVGVLSEERRVMIWMV